LWKIKAFHFLGKKHLVLIKKLSLSYFWKYFALFLL